MRPFFQQVLVVVLLLSVSCLLQTRIFVHTDRPLKLNERTGLDSCLEASVKFFYQGWSVLGDEELEAFLRIQLCKYAEKGTQLPYLDQDIAYSWITEIP